MKSKKTTGKFNFYLPILNLLSSTTNLTKIQKELNLSKQQLNYYLRELNKRELIIQKGRGWYEVVEKSKKTTKYGNLLSKDSSRGHAYVWNIKLPRKIDGWDRRIQILEQKKINFKLVGALKTTPRIKALGRNVWLCNDHLRIFDIKKSSYYGTTAKESRQKANLELFRIVSCLENKLGFLFKPFNFSTQKEHYALIKNDLAIDQNQKGIIMRISDEDGEWLLIDDSLEEGGELETVGKKAYKTNLPMQNWWNDNKKHDFQVTPSFILNGFNQLTVNQSKQHEDILLFAQQLNRHIPAYEGMALMLKETRDEIKNLKETIKELAK